MAGILGLSIDPKSYQGNFPQELFWLSFYLQHLGEDMGGLSVYTGKKVELFGPDPGLLHSNFGHRLHEISGSEAISYCGPGREPFFADSKLGEMSLCFSGNLLNLDGLIGELKNRGHLFEKGADIEAIAHLIIQGEGVLDGIKKMNNEIVGAYALLLLTQEGIYAVRCPSAQWPLIIGEKQGAVVVASEARGFSNFGFRRVRDLEPGEIILLKNGHYETKAILPCQKVQICSFLWVYTLSPDAVIEGIPVSLVRKKLGAVLARHDIEDGFIPDVVAPIPDSGRFHAIGYHNEFCRQIMLRKIKRIPMYDEPLIKVAHMGRSFTPQEKEIRHLKAHVKIVRSGEDYSGLVLVLCDDSLVRGTQTQTHLVPKARALGVKEIHFRFSNPKLLSHCPWGKTTRPGETLAHRMPSEEAISRFLGVDSVKFNSIEGLAESIGLPLERICVDCSRQKL